MLACFSDEAEFTAAPGTFHGKDAIRRFLEWDARLSPTATVRDVGVGVMIRDHTVVWERVISLTYENVPYLEQAVAIVEFDDTGLIRRFRSYYDKLNLLEQIMSGMHGVSAWCTRKLVGYLVAQGKKGLDTCTT